jgi:VIT1/CCC1 family predicted Fe2+/Mn2+ transporter
MSKEMTVIALGALVAVTPYLGIPGSWKTALLALAGLALAGLGFLLRGESIARAAGRGSGHFVENSAPAHKHRDHGISSLN